jgi:hypothetical protein
MHISGMPDRQACTGSVAAGCKGISTDGAAASWGKRNATPANPIPVALNGEVRFTNTLSDAAAATTKA